VIEALGRPPRDHAFHPDRFEVEPLEGREQLALFVRRQEVRDVDEALGVHASSKIRVR
jgi:hypothetical protein